MFFAAQSVEAGGAGEVLHAEEFRRKLKLINENWRYFRQKLRLLFSCMFSFGLMLKNAFLIRLQNVGIKINCTFRLRMNYITYIPQALLSHKTRHAIAEPN